MKSTLSKIIKASILLTLIGCTTVPKDISSATSDFSTNFNGHILLVDNGLVVQNNSYGNKEQHNTKYRIGSVSKTFISASIAILIENHKLAYSQTIECFVPSLINANQITIENLIEHRSGLSDFSGKEYYNLLSRYTSKEELIDLVIEKKEHSTPNKKYYYSSMNYILLGYIIEQVSQQDITSFITSVQNKFHIRTN